MRVKSIINGSDSVIGYGMEVGEESRRVGEVKRKVV